MLKKIERLFRDYFPKRMNNHNFFLAALKGLNGIEIGGPSPIFTATGFLPIYTVIANLDGCNFSNNTVWEGNIQEGNFYRYGNKTGYQIISDGTKLEKVPDETYDFLLSCHSLEHIANPIKALNEWKRIIRHEGYILLVVPHKDRTFDHKRPITTLEHLVSDYQKNTEENDSTHFEEVINLHDVSMDDGITDIESLKKRTMNNFNNRCVHQHIFNTPLIVKLADYLNLKICGVQHFNPFNIIILLQKPGNATFSNKIYLDPSNAIYHNVKFPSDKNW